MNRRSLLSAFALSAASRMLEAQQRKGKTRNVILVTTDGLRWQDVFRGADAALLNKETGGVENVEHLRKQYWRESASERRAALMPFLWSVLAREGQLFGNRDLQSDAFVTNGRNFSYPGYSELLTGMADDRIDSNDKKNNPNVNVLEWLNGKKEYRGKLAALGAWDVLPFILNAARSGLLVNAGYEPLVSPGPSQERFELLNRMKVETGIWESEALDAPVFQLTLEYLRAAKPRVLYLLLGDTDEWAHSGRYDLYLAAANRVDRYLRDLWSAVQEMEEYRGSTTLMVGVDHGRGSEGNAWRSHGEKLPESKYVWLGALGPDTAPLGERSKTQPVTQNQIAATVAALLGEDYRAFNPKVGMPIAAIMQP